MDDDTGLRRQMRTLAPGIDEEAAWAILGARLHRENRARRVRRVVAATAAVVIVGLATAALLPNHEMRTDTIAPPPSSTTRPPTSTTQPPVTGDRWERLDSNVSLLPFSGFPVVVNTYDGLLMWGRTTQVQVDRNGQTRRLPPAPIAPRDDAGGAWTGSELIVWGGQNELDGAAYDLARDEWREIAPSPLPRGAPIATVWTGQEVLVWGGVPYPGGRAGAAYNPETDSWRKIADAPFDLSRANAVLVGFDTFIALGAAAPPDLRSGATAQALQYDASTDRWTVLPEPDLSPNATWMVWTGDEVIAWDYQLEARSYRPGDSHWEALPDLPLEARECSPGGGRASDVGVLATYCDQVALFDVTSRQWTKEQMPFPVALDGRDGSLFGPVEATGEDTLAVLTSEGLLLFH